MRRPEVGILALAMVVSACTIPTEMPNWDTSWELPVNVNNLSIDLTKIPLPTGVLIDSSGSPFVRTGFTAQVSSIAPISRTLGVQCPTCPSATAQKPAFSAPPATTTVNLTAGSNLQSGALSSGSQISIVLSNGFGFDPLNPPGGSPGTITLTVSSGTATLGTQILQGPATTLATGSTRTVTIPLAGTFTAASGIIVTMTMDSPAGSASQPVTMNPNQLFTATPTAIVKISTATVSIAANPLGNSSSSMPLADLDQMVNRIEDVATNQGALLLTVTNPMTIGANATLTFTGTKTIKDAGGAPTIRPMQTITKNVVLPAGGGASSTSTVSVNLTGTELRELLGSDVTATFAGTAIAGSTIVNPNSRITTTARMRLRVFVKEIK